MLERIQLFLARNDDHGIAVVDRPGGGRRDEDEFLLECLDTIQSGTPYVILDRLCFNVVSSSSNLIRSLQLADVIASCTMARVGGEDRFSPPVFERIQELMVRYDQRVGGIGLKIHPDFRYVNLYHWLAKEEFYWRNNVGHKMPISDFPYSQGPDNP